MGRESSNGYRRAAGVAVGRREKKEGESGPSRRAEERMGRWCRCGGEGEGKGENGGSGSAGRGNLGAAATAAAAAGDGG